MKLKLFNSLINRNDYLTISPGETFHIYLCGPTVYDHIHLGNLRPAIVFDVLFRFLLELGVDVKYVQNITDIDDKIILKARERNKSEEKITRKYTKSYVDNLINYNILFPTHFPKVSKNIEEIKIFIGELLKKGHAYHTDGEVVFSANKLPDYGKLSNQKLQNLKGNLRKVIQVDKKSENDFVL
jgi:cysteinyl-tRNA synthetase